MSEIMKDIEKLDKLRDASSDEDDRKRDDLREAIQSNLGLLDDDCEMLPEAISTLKGRVDALEKMLANHKHFADGSAGFQKRAD